MYIYIYIYYIKNINIYTYISKKVRLYNHQNNVKKAIMAYKHFQQESHNFNKHEELTLIDQLTNTSQSKETLTQRFT